MAAPKGNRNNPNGRPPKNKALTTALEASLGRAIEVDGKRVNGKRVLADLVVSFLTTGKAKFPGDEEYSIISIADWTGMVKWIYDRVDGRPIQPVGGSGDEGELVIKVKLKDSDD
jgi:hypothetical protein